MADPKRSDEHIGDHIAGRVQPKGCVGTKSPATKKVVADGSTHERAACSPGEFFAMGWARRGRAPSGSGPKGPISG